MSQPSTCLCTSSTAEWDCCVILYNCEHTRILASADLAAWCNTLQPSSDFSGFVIIQKKWMEEPLSMKLHINQVSAPYTETGTIHVHLRAAQKLASTGSTLKSKYKRVSCSFCCYCWHQLPKFTFF